jgi:hypothetical protein
LLIKSAGVRRALWHHAADLDSSGAGFLKACR